MKTLELLPPSETMYRALVSRDTSFEGIFYAGVRTTGIFCRPTCSAKKPARENVDFFATPSEALHGGCSARLRRQPIGPGQRPPGLNQRVGGPDAGGPGGRATQKGNAPPSIVPSPTRR